MLDELNIAKSVKNAVLQDYTIPDGFNWGSLDQIVPGIYLNRLIGPRLISETTAVLGLKKGPSAGSAIGDSDYIFDIIEGDKFFLRKLRRSLGIDGVKFSTLGS